MQVGMLIFLLSVLPSLVEALEVLCASTCNPPGSEGEVLQAIRHDVLEVLSDSLCLLFFPPFDHGGASEVLEEPLSFPAPLSA